jgi:RNA polymerase sigma factor (sigma-70 family)
VRHRFGPPVHIESVNGNPAAALRASASAPEAFADFYTAYFDAVLAFLARRLLDAEVAVDLTAESFAQAYVSRQRFRGSEPAQAEAWIYQIARRQLARYVRRGRIERRAINKLGIEVPSVDEEQRTRIEELADLDGYRAVLRAELARLSSAQREALELRVVGELSYAEVAARLRITEQAARLRVSRGLRALATALESDPRIKELQA